VSGIFGICRKSYKKYYNEARTHLSLRKDAPVPREVYAIGRVTSVPILARSIIDMFELSFRQGQALAVA
jgi:hypothetical protein